MNGTKTTAPMSRVDRLQADAASAAQVRALTTHPDVVALRVERVRAQVDALIWVGIGLGLAFTMVNVQTFAAAGAAAFTLPWLAAWVLDPMVSLVLIAVLRAEQVTARWQVPGMAGWVRSTKVFAFAATYVMNTWSSWLALGSTGSHGAAGIVLHSVPPVLVYCAAETGPILRDRLTEAVLRAARLASAPEAAPVDLDPSTGSPLIEQDMPAPVDPTAGPIEGEQPTGQPTRPPSTPRRPSTRPRTTGKPRKTSKPAARSWADLHAELDAAVSTGAVDPDPSAEQIRKALRIAPDRARALRDERRTSAVAAQQIGISPTSPDASPESPEVTRDAA